MNRPEAGHGGIMHAGAGGRRGDWRYVDYRTPAYGKHL